MHEILLSSNQYHCLLSFSAPSSPTAVTASGVTSSSARVTWAGVMDDSLLGYKVSFERVSGRGCASSHTDTESVSSTTTAYTVMGLSGFSRYTVSVVAVNVFDSSGVNNHTLETPASGESCTHCLKCAGGYTCQLLLHSSHWTSSECGCIHQWHLHHCQLGPSPLPESQQ